MANYKQYRAVCKDYARIGEFIWWYGAKRPRKGQLKRWAIFGLVVIEGRNYSFMPSRTPYESLQEARTPKTLQ